MTSLPDILAADTRLLRELSAKIVAQAYALSEPLRREAFSELISEIGVCAAGSIAMAMRGDDQACGVFCEAFVLQVTEALGAMARDIRGHAAAGALRP